MWNTRELAQQFVITSIIAPHVIVRRKADEVVGQMAFLNDPRYSHSFAPADPPPEAGQRLTGSAARPENEAGRG